MEYEVLARKWRPQQFDDVVGQEHVTRTLRNAIQANRIAHAYLFVGPRGIGKTSLARIFAKALNCEKGLSGNPCDQCDSCKEIMAGSAMDVLEIDGASNTGVDQVRDLRENVKYSPARGRFKIYIIDEVHMLSTAAFNALLKTLEEPPAHVKFIFATTEAQKILATILSRCQRFDLRRIPVPLIVGRLEHIAKAEKLTIEREALLAIARGADGGLRDAESALDQLVAFCGNRIAEADALGAFGLVSRQKLESIVEAVLQNRPTEILQAVAELDSGGKDMQRLVMELLEYFRNLLVHVCAPGAGADEELVEDQIATLKRLAALSNPDRLLRIAELLTQTEERMRSVLSKRTLVEMSLLRAARQSQVVAIDELLARIEALQQQLGGAAPAAPAPAPLQVRESAPAPAPAPAAPVAAPAATAAAPAPAAPAARAPAKAPAKPAAEPPAGGELELLVAQWPELIERIGKQALMAKTVLRDTRPMAVQGDRVVIGFDPEFAGERERAQEPRTAKAVQNVIGQVLRRTVSVEFATLPGDGPVVLPSDHKPDEKPAASASAPAAAPAAKGARKNWVQEPAVQKALEMFNGSIVDVRD